MCPADESVIVGSAFLNVSVKLRRSGSFEMTTHVWHENGHDNIGSRADYKRLDSGEVGMVVDGTTDALLTDMLQIRLAEIAGQIVGQEVFEGF
jgi:hypothetical protein